MKLYDYPRSSSAWRVRIALAIKGIEPEVVPVDIGRDAPDEVRDRHTPVNPLQQVPVLEWTENGTVRRLAQSVAIIEYLEELQPEPALLPADRFLRARARQLAEMVNAGIQPLQNNRVLQRLGDRGVDEAEWARWAIDRGLRAVDAILGETIGSFAVGDRVTVADIFLAPQILNGRNHGLPIDELANVARVERACALHPAFASTRPS
jgi:maleylpyruvate isomerase